MKTAHPLSRIILLFVCLWAGALQAQHEKDNWYFNYHVGINFPNSGAPVEVPNVSQIGGDESGTTVSDKTTGKLLFYTNGITVWNSAHQVMDNGNRILAYPRCSHVLSVPNPANASQYFIISDNNQANNQYHIRYSIVDMSENGGLGKVISTDNLISPFAVNKFTVAKHGSDDAYWLITYRGSGGNDTFECFPITTAGIQPPIRSIMGSHKGVRDLGDMVTNLAGDKIVIAFYSVTQPAVVVYNFSKTCGSVSTSKTLSLPQNLALPRGVAFSPDDSKLYFSANVNGTYTLLQYSGTDFVNVQDAVVEVNGIAILDTELGPDGKLYIISYDNSLPTYSPKIDVVENPNANPFSIIHKQNVIPLTDSSFVSYYLPVFMNDVSKPGNPPVMPVIDVKNTCVHDTTVFTPSNMPFLDSLLWNFNDPVSPVNTSTTDITSHIFSDTGTYKISLSWFNCGVKTSAYKDVTIISQPNVYLGRDTTLCKDNKLVLIANAQNLNYLWSTGATDSAIIVDKAGTYWLSASAGPRCSDADTITVGYYPQLVADFFSLKEFKLCEDEGETVVLEAGDGFAAYFWQPGGQLSQTITAASAGWQKVQVTNNKGCTATDSVYVGSLCSNTFFMPDAFTPNDDRLNDTFGPVYGDIFNYKLEIYTRWGEQVFVSEDPAKGWDGSYKGNALPLGVYIWRVRYQGFSDKLLRTYTQNGIVKLIR